MNENSQYYVKLAEAINEQITPIYNTTIVPIQFPSQGDFSWFYQNHNQIFNRSTFDYVSARVQAADQPGLAQISSAAGYPNGYFSVISSLSYSLSTQDKRQLDQELARAEVQGNMMVSTYEKIYGKITRRQMKAAQEALGEEVIVTSIDFVMTYILGYIWSGRAASGGPPLSYSEMATAQNLVSLLPDMPASGTPVVIEAAQYLEMLSSANALQDQVNYGNWVLQSLKNNTGNPSEKNGGMHTVDPNDGSESNDYQVAYYISMAVAQIAQELDDLKRKLKITISMSEAGEEQGSSIESGIQFGIEAMLQRALVDHSNLDARALSQPAKVDSLTIEYEGYSMVPTTGLAWVQNTNVGWYYGDPISEACRNGKEDVTGFKFHSDPPYAMGPMSNGGNFGSLQSILISNPPIVTINYSDTDFSKLKGAWDQSILESSLKRISEIGGDTQYRGDLEKGASNTELSIVLSPLNRRSDPIVPSLQQKAYVIGASLSFPPPLS